MSDAEQNLLRSEKSFVRDYSDLLAYRINFRLSQEIFELSKQFPKEEMYALTDQFRRASRSIGAKHRGSLGQETIRKTFSKQAH